MVVYSCPPEITNITWQPRIDPVTPGGVFFHGEGQRQGVSQSLLQAVTRGREKRQWSTRGPQGKAYRIGSRVSSGSERVLLPLECILTIRCAENLLLRGTLAISMCKYSSQQKSQLLQETSVNITLLVTTKL